MGSAVDVKIATFVDAGGPWRSLVAGLADVFMVPGEMEGVVLDNVNDVPVDVGLVVVFDLGQTRSKKSVRSPSTMASDVTWSALSLQR